MNYLRSFFPKTTKLPDTEFHERVSIVDYGSHKDLHMGNLIQSGEIMRKYWEFTLDSYIPSKQKIKSALLLGLGAGSNVMVLKDRYPDIKIDAVEIDKKVIDIAKIYFELDKIRDLNIYHDDAVHFVSKNSKQYDLVMLDCFGDIDIPKDLEDFKFIEKIKSHSTYFFLNRLYFHKYKQKTEKFIRNLREDFFVVFKKKHTNLSVYLP